MELVEDGEKSKETAKVFQHFQQSIALAADSTKGLGQVYESCIQTHIQFSAFLQYLPQHKDHVCGPSAEPTMAFWHDFLIYHHGEPVQHDIL